MPGAVVTFLAVIGGLAVVWANLKFLAISGLTASLVFNAAVVPPPPPVVPAPYVCAVASPCLPGYVAVSAPVAPVAPAPVAAATPAAQVSNDTRLIMDALTSMDLRQQGRDGKQDEVTAQHGRQINRLEEHLRSAPSPAPLTVTAGLPDCPSCDGGYTARNRGVTGLQRTTPR